MTRSSRRPGISPSLRAFLVCLLVILVTAGGGAAALFLLAGRDGGSRASEALDSGYAAFTTLERERFERLGQLARMVAAEPAIRTLVATEELSGEVLEPALATLEQTRFDFGFLLVLDADGRVLARTEDTTGGPDLAPVLATDLGDGIRVRSGKLFQTSTVAIPAEPSLPDVIPLGYVVAGQEIDNALLSRLKRISHSEVLLLASGPGGFLPVGGTLDRFTDAAVGGLSRFSGTQASPLERVQETGEAVDRISLTLGDRPYLALAAPLFDARRSPAGAVILLAESPPSIAGRRRELTAILGSAAVALLLSVPLSMLLGGSVSGPLRRLTGAVAGVRRGELDQRATLGVRRSGAMGALAVEVEGLLTDFVQEKALRKAVERAISAAPEASAESPTGADPATVRQAALLGVELRRFAHQREPAAVDRMAGDLQGLEAAVEGHGGRIEAILGHRVLASFEGQDRTAHALAAAGEALEALATNGLGLDEGEQPALALAVGPSVVGTANPAKGIHFTSAGQRLNLGLAVQLLESLMREAASGEILLSRDAKRELDEMLQAAGVKALAQRGMLTPQPLYSLDAKAALRVAGSPVLGTLPLPASELRPGPSADAESPAAGGVLGDRFEIHAFVGTGPLGAVYRALDRELGLEVALKVLRREALVSTEPFEALDSELASLRTFTDPHVARLYDFGVFDGVPFISRQWVDGLSMRELLQRVGPLAANTALGAGRQLAAGVAAAHRENLVHLRLKPENVLFQADGALRVADFGGALVSVPSGPSQEPGQGYLAPEQESGERGDRRSDVFACGLLLHRLFTAGGSGATAEPGRGRLPPAMEAIVRRCLETDPGLRFPHAGELLLALEGLGLQ